MVGEGWEQPEEPGEKEGARRGMETVWWFFHKLN